MSSGVIPNRESSPELGSPSRKPQYNRTGRPIRRRLDKVRHAGYVDSSLIDVDTSAEDSMAEDDEGNPIQAKHSRKRKRTPSPTPPPIEPIIYNEDPDELSEVESEEEAPPPVSLQFNVPLGFHGPLVVKLDKAIIESLNGRPQGIELPKKKTKSQGPPATSNDSTRTSSPGATKYRGFTALPPELRNKIYHISFVDDKQLDIMSPDNFCRSAAMLSTCKLVASEAPSVLYGENKFVFRRNRNTRSPFWDPVPKEIGYKDVRQFLKMIGPENIQYLRDVKIIFEDANPGVTPYLNSQEERRYINDEHLIDCLRILRNAPLRALTLTFLGRRALRWTNNKFMGYLKQLQADEVIHAHPEWRAYDKADVWVFDKIRGSIQRQAKLYNAEE